MATDKRQMYLQAGRAAAAGYFFIIAMGIGTGGGWLVDRYLTHSEPWGMVVGFLVGVVAGFKELYQIARHTQLGSPDGKDKKEGGA